MVGHLLLLLDHNVSHGKSKLVLEYALVLIYRTIPMHNIPFTKRIKNRDGYDVNVTIYIVCETDDGKNCFGKILPVLLQEKKLIMTQCFVKIYVEN